MYVVNIHNKYEYKNIKTVTFLIYFRGLISIFSPHFGEVNLLKLSPLISLAT